MSQRSTKFTVVIKFIKDSIFETNRSTSRKYGHLGVFIFFLHKEMFNEIEQFIIYENIWMGHRYSTKESSRKKIFNYKKGDMSYNKLIRTLREIK